ncbi:ABC transporter permease [Bryobacter aggregatus]|uniref:ABC transporter permease n=1 Tax=Bryobacter aggregatus TaxID=360054 RepID=UPI001EE22198|nr:FtsX-like permease family protein [Bryobacter aggregatus]
MTNKLVLENLKHRPIRTLLVVFAIAIQVNLMLTLVGMSHGMLSDFQERSRGVGADIIVRPTNSSILQMSAPSIKEAMVPYLRQQPHITDALGVTIHNMEGFLNSVTGIDIKRFNEFSGGFRFEEGGPWKNPNDVIVDEHYASQRKLHVNGPVTMMNKQWNVVGIVGSGKMSHVFMPIDVLQDLTSNSGKFSQIYLKVDDPKNVEEIVEQLKQLPALKDYPIYSMQAFTSLISIDNAPGLRPFLNVIVGLSIIVGFLVVFLSLYTAVLERTREIGILKSLGATPFYIIQLLFRETILLSILGGIMGIGLSYGSQWLIRTLVPASLQMQIVYDWWPISTAVAIGASLIGALYPGYKAARQDAIEALAYE